MDFDDIKELVATVVAVVAVAAIVFCAVFVPVALIKREQCRDYASVTGMQTRWEFFGGCYINAGRGRWYTMEEYKSAIAAKDTMESVE